ncbi:MAG: TRAP transporter large permease [Pseudomonadota bacterium]|nr:TRAP transporter large permease [Pseudomonadota bacterium]
MHFEPLTIGIIGIIALFIMVILGMRVVFAAALVGTVGLIMVLYAKPNVSFWLAFERGAGWAGTIPHAKSVSYTLSVLPMFILIGFLAFHAGITKAVFEAARRWIGWVPGGLAVASVFAAAGFAAVSGASTSTAAVFSRVAIPEMLNAGYDRRLAAGVVAAAGTLASLIPPSAILVIYAIIVEESVGKLLLAGLIPGIFSAVVYALLIIWRCWRNPALGGRITGYTWAERFESIPGTMPILIVIGVIIGGVYFGLATPTESGALGAFVVFVMALRRGMKWPELKDALLETAKLTVMIFSIIWGVLVFVRFLGFAHLPDAFAEWIVSLPVSPMMIMILILLAYAVLGMFMDAIGMMLLTLPVVYPAVMALAPGLGFEPGSADASIWFGIIVVKMVEICLVTPPIGLNCFVVAGVRPDIPLSDVFKGIGPFFIADVLTVAGLVAFPGIVTWLPNQMLNL